MGFLEQAKNNESNWGTYVLTVAFVFIALLIGQVVSELICASVLGHSLIQIPPIADNNTVLLLLLLPFVFVLVALIGAIKYFHKQNVLTLFTTRPSFDWKRVFFAFFVWSFVMVVLMLVDYHLFGMICWNLNWQKFIPLVFISLFILPLQTTAEEVFFRGFFLQGIGKLTKSGIVSIVVTGLFFGLLHAGNPEVMELGYGILAFYIVTGFFLAIITIMDDGLELAIGYHAANNVFASLILTNNWQAFQTDALLMDTAEPSFGWVSILTLLIVQPVLILIFSKKYKWSNWRKNFIG